MTFAVISREEILWKYETAIDKEEMLKVLCDLTVSSVREMEKFLEENGAM